MKLGLIIYGSLDTLSGGYLYDRKLVEYLRSHGDTAKYLLSLGGNEVPPIRGWVYFQFDDNRRSLASLVED
jgi:hypothetical protein